MDNYFIHSGIIAFVYLLLKFAEMRIVTKETKPLKDLMRPEVSNLSLMQYGGFVNLFFKHWPTKVVLFACH
jgi:hypothetical protein